MELIDLFGRTADRDGHRLAPDALKDDAPVPFSLTHTERDLVAELKKEHARKREVFRVIYPRCTLPNIEDVGQL